MVVGKSESTTMKNAGELLAILTSMQMRRYDAGCNFPMEHISGFNRSHGMLPSVKCSHRIAAAVAMVNDFSRKHKTLPKTYF
jgi:hypothetical protein